MRSARSASDSLIVGGRSLARVARSMPPISFIRTTSSRVPTEPSCM